jgi:hypothetical protein
MDAQVMRATRAGLSVFMTLGYTPAWVARHGDTDGQSGNDVPNASTEWAAFVREIVTRYRPMGVRHYGMWNEANLRQFWEGSLQEYSTLIANPGAAAVRAVCRDCFVLGPDLASVGDSDDALEAVHLHRCGQEQAAGALILDRRAYVQPVIERVDVHRRNRQRQRVGRWVLLLIHAHRFAGSATSGRILRPATRSRAWQRG